jgi:hypothetical protein
VSGQRFCTIKITGNFFPNSMMTGDYRFLSWPMLATSEVSIQ